MVLELFQKFQLQIYASQFMTFYIILLPFVLLNLERVERKEEKLKKFEYLENEKSFLDEIKNIFYSFWRPVIWSKNKHLIKKIADTSFKDRKNNDMHKPESKVTRTKRHCWYSRLFVYNFEFIQRSRPYFFLRRHEVIFYVYNEKKNKLVTFHFFQIILKLA